MTTFSSTHAPAWPRQFLDGCIACIPTVFGYLSIGFSAGALARVSGMSTLEIALMSLMLYAGSAQFIVAGMLQAHAAAVTVWVAVFFVNLRHLLMSAYLAPYFSRLGAFKSFIIGTQLTDETFGVAAVEAQRRGQLSFAWMAGLNLTAYLNWLLGNVIGALAAAWIPAHFLQSLGFALVAMFIGLIVLQLLAAEDRAPQVGAAALTVLLLEPVARLCGREFSVVLTAVLVSLIVMGVMRWKSATKSS